MHFIGGTYVLKIDDLQTRAFYLDCRPAICPCDACGNFVRAAPMLSPDVLALFGLFGINAIKPPRLLLMGKSGGGRQCVYEAEYPVAGRILRDGGPMTAQNTEALCLSYADATISFLRRHSQEIPRAPSFMMRATLWLPWVVNETGKSIAK